jgi:hypothetical protein
MAKLYIFTNENGNVTVTTPAPQALETMTHEEIMAKDCPSHAIMVDYDSLPWDDYDFFNSWELNAQKNVIINFTKAKEETRNRLRIEREPLLQAQDVLFQRALENSTDTTAIVAEKNRLRDITNLVDETTTLDQLRNLHC